MTHQNDLGGTFTFRETPLTVNRMGYGAMQLAGPHVFGPPKDRNAALAVLRQAVDSGVDHIDNSDYNGKQITNQIIKEALHPYPKNLTIVTKVGARRGDDGSWIQEFSAGFLKQSVEDNLRNLGLDSLQIVNLRAAGLSAPTGMSIAEPLAALAELQGQGLIQHIGLSNVSPAQFEEARPIAKIVCVQNFYNVAHREDDAFIDALNAEGVAYVPFFPLGGFNPLQSSALDEVAATLEATPMAVALAWLLPGTSSAAHLREHRSAASLQLPEEILGKLNGIAQA